MVLCETIHKITCQKKVKNMKQIVQKTYGSLPVATGKNLTAAPFEYTATAVSWPRLEGEVIRMEINERPQKSDDQ